ncbi:MAG: response regulator transcription factor [Candidatus Acidiferrales bacterium]
MSRVMIVEDEAHLAEGLKFNLKAEGHTVAVVGDGDEAVERLVGAKEQFDAVILDVMLPGRDGFAVVSELRKAKNYVPVLMLTARGRAEDVLQGFAAGADDYLPKPFELPIFLARLQGLLRRSEWLGEADKKPGRKPPTGSRENPPEPEPPDARQDKFTFGGKTIDFRNLELQTASGVIQLTLMEAKLLKHLVENAGQTVSRKSILEDVWGVAEDTDTRAIDNFIVRLRKYIEKDPAKPKHVLTVRGVGYRFEAAADGAADQA